MATTGQIPSNITVGAGQAVRRNAGDTLFEAFTPASTVEIPQTLIAPTGDATITAGYFAYVGDYYEIASTYMLEVGDLSVFEIG